MSDYDPIMQRLEADLMTSRDRVRQVLYAEGRPDIVADLDRKFREIDNGINGARSAWHSISLAQRRALTDTATHGGRLMRDGKEYRHRDRHQPYRPIYARTVRALCAHELMTWTGGAFDPEAAAVITERGLFVLRHGGGYGAAMTRAGEE